MRQSGTYGTAISAEMIGSQHRPVSFASGRVCAVPGCATRLSIYNSDPFCSIHAHISGRLAPALLQPAGSKAGGRVKRCA